MNSDNLCYSKINELFFSLDKSNYFEIAPYMMLLKQEIYHQMILMYDKNDVIVNVTMLCDYENVFINDTYALEYNLTHEEQHVITCQNCIKTLKNTILPKCNAEDSDKETQLFTWYKILMSYQKH